MDKLAFTSHSSKRISHDESTLQTVNVFHEAGAKKTSILMFITDNSNSNPKPQDIHNLVRKLKTRENDSGPTTSAQRLKKWMTEFGEAPGNVVAYMADIFEEFKANNPAWKKLQCVLIDKDFTEMSVLKKAFPSIVILLCQFHVLKYLREAIVSADYGFSSWQKEQLRVVMSLLVDAKTNMEYESHLRYMENLASIGYSAPRHVISTGVDFSTGAHEPTSERQLESSVGQQLGSVGSESATAGNMGNLPTSDTHGTGAREQASTECASHPFTTYFMKNGDNCREQWCAQKGQNTVTLGNNISNRLEASWKQHKEWVDF
ncbi:unnamed protein product [Phytophthora fragariaefolia]|uniref:Unnamed protein product n=1 Tax=Phytophthora fragariaefolia TaxID=1490495 RepID=A0A9W7CL64_9STRA|nr:unnamed protein product [Phytophthora fragariaefolia]